MNRLKAVSLANLLLLAALCTSCRTAGETSSAKANAQTASTAPAVDVIKVISQKLNITVTLPGELQPYQVVAIYPKVTGFVDWIGVDRGSRVRTGQLIVRVIAPELVAQRSEAQAKLQSAEAQRVEAEAKLAADQSTYERLKAAAATPGVVSGNDLVVAEKAAEGDRARARAAEESANAAKQSLRSISEIEGYLQVKAPFDSVVTERNVHPGALVGPAGGSGVTVPMVRIETLSRLRLVVPVPEAYVAGIPERAKVEFTVPAYPGETFSGPVVRIAHSVDFKTRTMPVELDVMNPSGRLASGMFPQVLWPVRRPHPTLFVPASAVARTTERIFVVRIRDGKTEWVDVKTGASSGSLIEIFGDLKEGDEVALRGTDELRPDTPVSPREHSSS
jgi:membrane fusion protein, multidrug efflux system